MGLFSRAVNLNTAQGILSIRPPKKKETKDNNPTDNLISALNKAATAHKKNGNMELAIICLYKVNELMPFSFYMYTRKDYQRVVEYLKDASRFDEARAEQQRLDAVYGTEIQWLQKIMKSEKTAEDREKYRQNIIVPKLQEIEDRGEYDYLREFHPEIAPKSFSGYRRMKNGNTAQYQKLADVLRK